MSHIRKQTRLWITRTGERVRVCDMSDDHLNNAIKMLERYAKVFRTQQLAEGYEILNFLHGEYAIQTLEDDLRRIEEAAIEELVPDIYESLLLEKERREKRRTQNAKN